MNSSRECPTHIDGCNLGIARLLTAVRSSVHAGADPASCVFLAAGQAFQTVVAGVASKPETRGQKSVSNVGASRTESCHKYNYENSIEIIFLEYPGSSGCDAMRLRR